MIEHLAIFLALHAGATTTGDAPRRVGVGAITVEGELPAAWAGRLRAALRRGLRELEVEALAEPTGACDDACWIAHAAAAGAEVLVLPHLVADGNLFDLEMRVLDGTDGTVLARRAEPCKPCGRADLEALVQRQSASLGEWIRSATWDHVLEVEASPVGAEVFVDGERIGGVPVTVRLPAGEHHVLVRAAGHRPRARTLSGVRGVTERWTVTLDPLPAPSPTDRLWPAGWAAIGLGAASLSAGATFLALHHRPYRARCEHPDYDPVNDLCRQRYATLPHGAVLTAVGSAVLATGIALAVAGHRRRHGRAPAVETAATVARGRFTASIRGRF